jgi:hypothetical protein
MSSTYVDGIALTKEAIGLARNSKDPALLLETLTIGRCTSRPSARCPMSCGR